MTCELEGVRSARQHSGSNGVGRAPRIQFLGALAFALDDAGDAKGAAARVEAALAHSKALAAKATDAARAAQAKVTAADDVVREWQGRQRKLEGLEAEGALEDGDGSPRPDDAAAAAAAAGEDEGSVESWMALEPDQQRELFHKKITEVGGRDGVSHKG